MLESLAMLCLGVAAMKSDEPEDAARLLGKCVEICRETGNKWVLALALRDLGHMAAHRNDYALARPPLEESILLFSEMGTKHELATTLDEAATVESADGDYARAVGLWQRAMVLWRDLGVARKAANDLHNLGQMAEYKGTTGLQGCGSVKASPRFGRLKSLNWCATCSESSVHSPSQRVRLIERSCYSSS